MQAYEHKIVKMNVSNKYIPFIFDPTIQCIMLQLVERWENCGQSRPWLDHR